MKTRLLPNHRRYVIPRYIDFLEEHLINPYHKDIYNNIVNAFEYEKYELVDVLLEREGYFYEHETANANWL